MKAIHPDSSALSPEVLQTLSALGPKEREQLINKAVLLYLHQDQFLHSSEKLYWQKVEEELESGTEEYISLGKNDISDVTLENALWK